MEGHAVMPLTNTQYDLIMRDYEARQTANRHLLEERRKEVYEKLPQLRLLEDQISSNSVSRARFLLDGDEDTQSALKQEIQGLIRQKAQLLQQAGYPADYLEMKYQCPDCRDTGYINNQKCHCLRQAAIDLVYTQSNMRRILERENFSTFSFDYYSKEVRPEDGNISSYDTAHQAVSTCRKFLAEFDTSFGNLLFYGNTGVGKTFLSNCIAKELLDTGHSVIYFTAGQLFHLLEQDVFHKDAPSGSDYRNLFECDLLIIDDLGTEFSNSFTTSQLFSCLNERILRQRSTIISTNLSIPQLVDLYSERTFSRITSHYTIIKLLGDDIRILKKMRRQ